VEVGERVLRSVVRSAYDVISVLEADGTVRYINPAVERVLGYRPEELVGISVVDLIHPDDLEQAQQNLAENLANPGLRPPHEFRMAHKDGSWRCLEHSVNNLLEDPDVGGLMVISRDVTERKETEKALEESEELFRGSFDDASIGMALVGIDGRWLRVNWALCEIVGYSEEELLEKTFQEITHPDDLEADLDYVRRLMAGEIRTYQMEKRYLHKEGHEVWVLLNGLAGARRGGRATLLHRPDPGHHRAQTGRGGPQGERGEVPHHLRRRPRRRGPRRPRRTTLQGKPCAVRDARLLGGGSAG
jgi:PAS domain S-box-containing protein